MKISDLARSQNPNRSPWPSVGEHEVVCTDVRRERLGPGTSPALRLILRTVDGKTCSDVLWLSTRNLPRLGLVAVNLCGLDPDADFGEDKDAILEALTRYIETTARGRRCVVVVEPDGRFRRIAFDGYRPAPDLPGPGGDDGADGAPF